MWHQLCTNCLGQHTNEPCKSGNSRQCNQPHHTRLHDALQPPTVHDVISTTVNTKNVTQTLIWSLNLATDLADTNVLLLTVTISVLDKFGRLHACRAVLDCASHTSYITREFCQQLRLPTVPVDFEFGGISGASGLATEGALITFGSRCSDYQNTVSCVVLDRITSELPLKPVNITGWPIPRSIVMADPQFHHPGKISMLLGNKIFSQLLEPGSINLSSDGSLPILLNTKLGWVVSGGYKNDVQSIPSPPTPSCLLTITDETLSTQLQRFWEIEEYQPPKTHLSNTEVQCEKHFSQHTTHDEFGRFTVRFPFIERPDQLGESREIAANRFAHLERKLEKNPILQTQYHQFIREYIDMGHMSLASNAPPKTAVFLPHHCVVKADSSTTKCRVIFDASAKTNNRKSLNDILLARPVLQTALINISLRFRFPAVVVAGDLQKMYRMVQLYDDQRDLQRILWRWSRSETLAEYRLNTVTYGTKSASYLATKCMQQVLLANQQKYPTAVERALQGMYVDDVLTGTDSEEDAKLLREQLVEIFASGGFHLRKLASNSTVALQGVPESDLEIKVPLEIDPTNIIKALGIHWQPCSDMFQFTYHQSKIL
ncbi:uncharacterized protein LOC129738126 [Uranotaenia lowii]|uniref:uncharacterized protein LOC129738126 n=1 Tax=Uranotaenia lowii TaxID=190385 RepID=UPI002478B1B9|nr:uncharacterized protein LOC129738126 [Uranotaenia lowii]